MLHPDHRWILVEGAPLYVMRFPSQTTDQELRGLIEAREHWARECRHTHAWLVDLSAVEKVPASQRRMFGEHLREMRPCDIRYNAGSGIVVGSPIVRGILTAVFWITPPEFPHSVHKYVDDARDWCRAQLARRLDSGMAMHP